MKEIQLSKGYVTKVDDEDFEKVNTHKWHSHKTKTGHYARGKVDGKLFYLHRFLLNAPKGLDVDHINHDGLDNRRKNLRLCTRQQNLWRARKRKNNKSGYKGVFERKGKWFAIVSLEGNGSLYVGSFASPEEAARAYDDKVKQLRGEFSYLNFPED